MTAAAESPDIRQLQKESLPPGEFPVGGKQDFRVFLAPAVHARIWQHATENLALEICGVLVGSWQRDAVGPFVAISEFIRCDAARSGFAEVTFTHEAWTKINAEMDTRLSGLKIVGWYHSHPDFGIFLSDRDVFIHQHFFSGAGQIAHVIDPVRTIEGVFARQGGKPTLRPHFWVGEQILTTPERPPGEETPRAATAETAAAQAAASDRWSPWLQTATMAALFVCIFLLGYLLAGRRTDLERRLERQRDLEGVVAQFVRRRLVRPGLEEYLDKIGADLQRVSKEIEQLSRRHVKLAGDDGPAVKDQWSGARERLTAAEELLREMRTVYVLAPDEQALVKEIEREILQAIAGRALQSNLRQADTEDRPEVTSGKSDGDRKRQPDEQQGSPPEKSKPPAAKPVEKSSKTDKSSNSSRE